LTTVERIEPVQERERKEAPQLDDTKSTKGLGEIYADEYMKQKVGVALGEKEDPIVAEVKKLWALLSYRLDALSRTGFVEEPKDIEARIDRELALKAQGNLVPATFNEATHQAPEEIFAGGDGKGGQRGSAAGNIKADDELTKEERKAGRAKRKRKSKAVREEKDRIKSQRDRQREAQLKAAGGGWIYEKGAKGGDARRGASRWKVEIRLFKVEQGVWNAPRGQGSGCRARWSSQEEQIGLDKEQILSQTLGRAKCHITFEIEQNHFTPRVFTSHFGDPKPVERDNDDGHAIYVGTRAPFGRSPTAVGQQSH
jgi:hypothetical protein